MALFKLITKENTYLYTKIKMVEWTFYDFFFWSGKNILLTSQ